MPIYVKDSTGNWVTGRPYIKVNGSWVPLNQVEAKYNGSWTDVFRYDVTPPVAPGISVSVNSKPGQVVSQVYVPATPDTSVIVTNPRPAGLKPGQAYLSGYHTVVTPGIPAHYVTTVTNVQGFTLNISLSFPQAQSDLRLVRVLISNTNYPVSPSGSEFVHGTDSNYASEAWSDWYFNSSNPAGGNSHGDGSVSTTKIYPATAGSGLFGSPGQGFVASGTYYISAWSLDNSGNWSDAATTNISVSTASVGNTQTKTETFVPTYSGTFSDATGWSMGDLVQQGNPISRGLYFYGATPGVTIGGSYGDNSTQIQNAWVYLTRTATTGPTQSNVTGFLHYNSDPAHITTPFTEDLTVDLGTLGIGQSSWFQLPTSWYAALKANAALGIGFSYKTAENSSATANDYSVLAGNSDVNYRAGQLRVNWTENTS